MHQPLSKSNHNNVSVVIPAYNSSKFLPAAIESVLNQTYPNVEIVVVDDGSTDDTKVVCDRYPTITYIYQSNQGVSSARNTGIRVSQGAYLIFLDSDDCLLPDAVEIGVNCLNDRPEIGFVFGSYLFKTINPDGSYTTQKLFDEPPAVASYATILAAQHKIQCSTVIFRRIAIDAVGGFDANLAVMEDLNLFLRVARKFPIYFHDRVVSEYRYHGGNVSSQSAKMLIKTLAVQSLERSYLQQHGTPADLTADECGRATWIKFFGDRLPYEIMRSLQMKNWVAALGNFRLLLNYDPYLESIDREVSASAELALRAQLAELPLQSSLAYWQQQLSDAPGFLSLPTDRPRLTQPTFQGKSQSFEIDLELTTALNLLSQHQGVTLSTTLLAAFKTLLYRYTGSEDIIVGTPTVDSPAERLRQRIDSEIFVNAVALRSNLGGNLQFQVLLQQVQQIANLAHRHQAVPIELIEGLQLQFTLVFEEDIPFDQIELSRLTAIPWTIESDTAKFDLTLYVKQTSNGLGGQWVYSTELFDATTIDRLNRHFHNLLTGIVANPNQSISELPLLTDSERQQLIGTNRQPQQNYASTRCLHQLFEEQVARNPEQIAVVFEDQTLTYRELNSRANQLARHLQSLGVESNVLVGICVERSLETIIGILGIFKAGGAYLPLDPSNPADRLEYILKDASVSILLTESVLLDNLPDCRWVICLDTDLPTISRYPTNNLADSGKSTDLAYVIYTSGSTGKPKGVLVNHDNVTRLFTATDNWYHFNDRDVWTLFHSFAFDFSVWEIWGALLYGGKLVVVPYFVSRDPAAFYQLLVSEQVTVLNQTPSAFYQLSKIDERLYGDTKLNLRLIIFGGEALNLPSLEPWFDRHGDILPQLVNMYGITETTVHVTYRPLTRNDVKSTVCSIGRPIPDLQVYILDAYLQPVPIGVSGEMYVGGAGVSQGYWQRDELTQERFIRNPFTPTTLLTSALNPSGENARLYKTGDLARYLADGNLEYIGRIDTQVKIRGFRIELGEIEALLSQHPEIENSIVIVREDLPGDKRLVAYLVTQNRQLTTTQLREFLSEQLPTYMIPTVFAIVAALPLTINGKVDRRALLGNKIDSQIIGGDPNLISNNQIKPNLAHPNLAIGSTARNPTEEILVAIWSEVLGKKQVGINENFFELGGHSISIIQVAAGIQQQLGGIEVSVVKLFQYPTIARLAAYLNGSQNNEQSDLKLKNRAQQQKAANARRQRL
ncbi:amino acid adenylation domain-containing protein [Chamaesiphon sp. VAR_48_metabat_135_sub]|uniref:amino acid adenylation domain-containing protein n=1 Tax=Chamaesiphon sp. VAR_48_metabat_135_sub TaxID=2964699 RepID=UPI00286C451B|nr:amino acid adenylation domain-containing protein [Chamaesiphon sp. VAR_48_metabat_135_sub]